MSPPQCLQIINPAYCAAKDAWFPQFPKLSPELRARIWELSAPKRHRLLEVEIESPSDYETPPPHSYTRTNSLNSVISGRRHSIIVRSSPLYSKLLRVNSESRQETLRFYRVHIPCDLQSSHQTHKRATQAVLFLNPEYDFIHPEWSQSASQAFIDLVHDIKAYDPYHIGLLNLAMDINDMTHLLELTQNIKPRSQETLVDCLWKLRDIIWMVDSATGRAILGPINDFHAFLDMNGVGVKFNHAMPVKSTTPSFDLLERDPRAVGPELKFVATAASDPRQMRINWQKLLCKHQIRHTRPVRERVLFAYGPPPWQARVCNIEAANAFLQDEQERWLGTQQKWYRVVKRHAGKVPIESPEELAKATRPAVGFWLFPVEAFGDLQGDVSGMKKVFDLTGHWPQLALSLL